MLAAPPVPAAPSPTPAAPSAPARARKKEKTPVGWKEWVELPELAAGDAGHDVGGAGLRVRAKVDTGAKTSSLFATDIATFERDGDMFARFTLPPRPGTDDPDVACEAELVGDRKVKSSNGVVQLRPVVRTHALVCGRRFPLELTLADRGKMKFRMLLGREALRHRFLVDVGKVWLGGR